jgi:hypothetical protein
VAADALATLDGPEPIGPCQHVATHRGVPVEVGAEPTLARMVSSLVMTSIVTDRLWGPSR